MSVADHKALVVTLLRLLLCVSATNFRIPRLSAHPSTTVRDFSNQAFLDGNNTKIYYYTQTLDHFNYRPDSYLTFRQKYIINFTYWGGANASAPIVVHFGAESPIGNLVSDNGLSARLSALMVSIEHRYYGESVPFGSHDLAYKNASTLGYFSSAQAIADYAEIILHIKKALSAASCPVLVTGGSYGGMLATWFRLKYPHVAMGALASSAPILYFDGIGPVGGGYYGIVTKDFKDTSRSCYNTIRKSWSKINEMANRTNGLSMLSKKFRTCSPLSKSSELKDYLDMLYCTAAQYNRAPEYMLNQICEGIDGAPKGTGILGRIFAGVASAKGNLSCYDMNGLKFRYEDGWRWQICTEIVMPIGPGIDSTMFPYSPFNLSEHSESCHKRYSVVPRPHWITTEYGGQDIKHVLANFGSNIIFSNGLRDPYSSGGVLQNISDSIIAITTAEGSHCLDYHTPVPTDPGWLLTQRSSEMEIIQGWIADYNAKRSKL